MAIICRVVSRNSPLSSRIFRVWLRAEPRAFPNSSNGRERCPAAIARSGLPSLNCCVSFQTYIWLYAQDGRQLTAQTHLRSMSLHHLSVRWRINWAFRFAAPAGRGRRQRALAFARFRRDASGDGMTSGILAGVVGFSLSYLKDLAVAALVGGKFHLIVAVTMPALDTSRL